MKKVQFRSMNLLTFFFFGSNGKSEATLIFFIAIVNIQVEIVNRRLIQLLCKENDNWTVELSRLHDKSTVHRKLSQLKIITQIQNFKLNEGESKKERVEIHSKVKGKLFHLCASSRKRCFRLEGPTLGALVTVLSTMIGPILQRIRARGIIVNYYVGTILKSA